MNLLSLWTLWLSNVHRLLFVQLTYPFLLLCLFPESLWIYVCGLTWILTCSCYLACVLDSRHLCVWTYLEYLPSQRYIIKISDSVCSSELRRSLMLLFTWIFTSLDAILIEKLTYLTLSCLHILSL